MQYLGDKSPGATIAFWFTSADADGAPAALSSGAISVYKDNSDTQSTSGVTLSASADSVTGANRVVIDTSADGTFYSAGSDFTVMLTAGTVDGTSVVGYVVGRFTLRESAAYDAVAAGVGLADGAITAAKLASNAITDAKIASGALTAAKFAAGAFDAVWSVATRLLTAGTNIVLAKGTGVTGFNDLDAGGVRTAVGLASANLDTQLGTIDSNVDAILVDTDTTLPGTLSTIAGYIDTEVAAIKAVTDNLPDAGALTSLATASDLATVDSNVDAIKAVTDNLPDGGALTTLQASVNAQDTGAVASAVWGFSSRALTAFNHDTGVAHATWNAASRTVTDVTGFSDTGVNDRLSKIGGDADTGLRDAISDARYVDTGPTADLAVLRAGVNVASLRSDTGAASRLQKLSGNQLKEDGTFDTGTGQATNTFNVQANVTLDTGTPINVQVDIPAIVSGVWGAGSRTLTDIDTGVITTGVWSASARTLTNYHDTGIDQSLASLQAGVSVTRFSDTGVNDRLAKILGDADTGLRAAIAAIPATDTGAVADAVWNAQRSAHIDTGTFGEHLGGELSASASIDTGAIANAVWGKDARTLTDYHDTGIDQELARISARVAEADTGLRGAIAGAAYVDTGPTADLTALRAGVNVSSFADTGVNNRLARIQAETDTGIRSAIQAAVYSDTGPTADLAQIIADTTTLKAGVNVTSFADTGVNNRLSRIQAEADTGLRSHITAAVPSANITAIKAQTDKLTFDTGGEVLADIRKVANVTVAGTGDTGLGDTWRPAAE